MTVYNTLRQFIIFTSVTSPCVGISVTLLRIVTIRLTSFRLSTLTMANSRRAAKTNSRQEDIQTSMALMYDTRGRLASEPVDCQQKATGTGFDVVSHP